MLPVQVEAMSNIGTTLKALGQSGKAESWWKKAISLRPSYFDSVENLRQFIRVYVLVKRLTFGIVGVLCNSQPTDPNDPTSPRAKPRFEDGLAVCNFVEKSLFADQQRPYGLPPSIPINHLHRLQNLFYAKGNLQLALGHRSEAKADYEKGIEIMLSCHRGPAKSGKEPVSVAQLILAATLAGLILMERQNPQPTASPALTAVLKTIERTDLLRSVSKVDMLAIGTKTSSQLGPALRHIGGGFLPQVLLDPTYMQHLTTYVFGATSGFLPTLAQAPAIAASVEDRRRAFTTAQDQTNQTTSTILLTLSKLYQDSMSSPNDPIAVELTKAGLPPHSSILLPLYYLSLCLHPSPSTYNNLGILLSTISATTIIKTPQGLSHHNGQALAMLYYRAGLDKSVTFASF